jgi:N-acetylmuramoyl-L-alanine amidase
MKNTTKLFLALTAMVSLAFIKPGDIEPKQINVVIDAAHGGSDFGAISNGITEKQIAEQITNKIYDLNKNKNVVIHLTRSSDMTLTLSERTAIINKIKPDLVLSLHVNANSNKLKSGMEMYVSKENKSYEKSNVIAEKLNDKLAKNNNLKSTEIKNANFFMLKKSEVPAIIVELGYITNENDRKQLTKDLEQDRIAQTIVEFISELE